ncbi:iron-siderophore ABC transporter substrate-binding protein [Shimazuella sp. AN120528]|nr:iron-siderophore ABC transporter substrate-binding protein [Shimazuella soli]MCH5585696.1 iron-siderophore ABC transporter substrate-binding protein [Shimazuella soli]
MRKWLSSLVVLALLLFALTGCTPEKSENAGNTISIKHAMGTTKVPTNPKRIVVLTSEGTEALLALGIKPVGAVQPYNGNPWYDYTKNKLQGVKLLGIESAPNLEAIASLKPDLIIGNKMRQEKVYTQLSAIAPTVFSEELRGDWKINFQLYAKAVNREAEGKKVLAAYEQHIGQTKKALGDLVHKKVSVVRFMPGQTRIYQLNSFTGAIFKELGFQRPANQNKNDLAMQVTREQIPEMDADILFYFTFDKGKNNGGTKLEQEFTNDPLWKSLHAVQQKHAFKVDDIVWNTAGGILAANKMLDQLVEYTKQMK